MIWPRLSAYRLVGRLEGFVQECNEPAPRLSQQIDRLEPTKSETAGRPTHAELLELRELLGAPPKANGRHELGDAVRALQEALHAWRGVPRRLSGSARVEVFAHRQAVLERARHVEAMLDALRDSRLAASFPRAQLMAIRDQARADAMGMLEPVVKEVPADALPAATLDADAALGALARLLPETQGTALLVKARPGIDAMLCAYALLADQALHAPDYDVLPRKIHPQSRSAHRYRSRSDAHSVQARFASMPRRDATREALTAALSSVARSSDAKTALGDALTAHFVGECGIPAAFAKTFKPTPAAVAHLLRHEALTPLRALWAYRGEMTEHEPELHEVTMAALADITGAMLEGRYERWRYEGALADRQLRSLSPEQRAIWEQALAHRHGRYTTREENGVERLWVTKIGGPSHGFDHGGRNLLPLLANAYTTAILVDDPRYPDNAAARCYLRLLEDAQGKATLYLEPLQTDFPYRGSQRELYTAIVRHAVAKAEAMGLPLASADGRFVECADMLELPVRDGERTFILPPSRGVREASDTLLPLHDWPQMEQRASSRLFVAIYVPRSARQ